MIPNLVSVIIVSFNTKDKLRTCLRAVEQIHEVIVVDNASKDGSVAMVKSDFPRVLLYESESNLGFGAANNRGLDLASGEFALFLNSDAYAKPGAIQILADELDDSTFVGAGGQLLNVDGSVQESTANRLTLWAVFCEQFMLEKAFKSNPFFSPYWTTLRHLQNFNESRGLVPTDQLMGACLMIRRINERWPEKFDERYFLYCEDTDLCLRLQDHGQLGYWPPAEFTHELGSSSLNNRWLGVARYNRGKTLYFKIHHGALAASICWVLNKLGATVRLLYWAIRSAMRVAKDPHANGQCGLFWRVLLD